MIVHFYIIGDTNFNKDFKHQSVVVSLDKRSMRAELANEMGTRSECIDIYDLYEDLSSL